MSNTAETEAQAFQREMKALILKYRPQVEIDTGYYGDVDGIDFCIGGVRAVGFTEYGYWDFDGDGLKSLDDIDQNVP